MEQRFEGRTVYYFRKSGQTGRVAPLGAATVDQFGYAYRTFNAKRGQILAVYGKILGVPDIVSPYSNTSAFKLS